MRNIPRDHGRIVIDEVDSYGAAAGYRVRANGVVQARTETAERHAIVRAARHLVVLDRHGARLAAGLNEDSLLILVDSVSANRERIDSLPTSCRYPVQAIV